MKWGTMTRVTHTPTKDVEATYPWKTTSPIEMFGFYLISFNSHTYLIQILFKLTIQDRRMHGLNKILNGFINKQSDGRNHGDVEEDQTWFLMGLDHSIYFAKAWHSLKWSSKGEDVRVGISKLCGIWLRILRRRPNPMHIWQLVTKSQPATHVKTTASVQGCRVVGVPRLQTALGFLHLKNYSKCCSESSVYFLGLHALC